MTMSDRLTSLLLHSQGRNLRATFAQCDASGICDTTATLVATDRDVDERFIRERLESGICWRDPHAGSPVLRKKAMRL